MRTYRPRIGPFTEALYLSKDEIDQICYDELQKQELLPTRPEPVRIDRFIEKRFVTPSYEHLGPGILGFTKFGAKGVQEIVINSELEEENTTAAERRIRSTLAHEAGHGLLHTHLFVLSNQRNPLFVEGNTSPKVLCRNELDTPSQRQYRGNWWEFQANRAIGSLLMPRHLVEDVMADFLQEAGQLGVRVLPACKRAGLESELSRIFDVNPVVARIRVQEVCPRSEALQGVL